MVWGVVIVRGSRLVTEVLVAVTQPAPKCEGLATDMTEVGVEVNFYNSMTLSSIGHLVPKEPIPNPRLRIWHLRRACCPIQLSKAESQKPYCASCSIIDAFILSELSPRRWQS